MESAETGHVRSQSKDGKMLKTLERTLRNVSLVAGCMLAAFGPALAADPGQGKAIAERWCNSCHVVEAGQKKAATDQAPPFASIAKKPDFGAARLALLLLAPHPNMPKLALSQTEIADLAGYILTLK
jgi:mono/diheme cytochrome c family protein